MKTPKRIVFLAALTAAVVALLGRRAEAQYAPSQYMEAECPDSATGAYATKQTSVTGFSGSGYLRSNGNTTPGDYDNTSTDHAIFKFTIRYWSYYRVWFRINTNNSSQDDSFFYQVSPGYYPDWITVNSVSGPGWRWVQGEVFGLPVGAHTIEIANREDGFQIDKIAVLPLDQTPTGTGLQAYNCPIPMYFETECRSGAFANYQLDRSSKSGYSGSGYIEASTDHLNVDPRADEATYFFESGASAYNLFFRIHNNSDATKDSWFYQIDGGSWTMMNNTSGLGSGWRWAQGVSSVSLAHDKHTLRIRNREKGLSIDKIAFVPTSATGPSGTGAGPAAVNCEPFQTMADWGPAELNEYYSTHLAYLTDMGAEMLPHHEMWHMANGDGGQQGDGSGVGFLGYHRAMLNEFRRYALEHNGRSWLPVAVAGRSVPQGLPDSYQALMALNRLDEYLGRANSVVTDFGVPAYLTIGGVPSVNPSWSPTTGPHTNHYKLEDFENLDYLGQGIGNEYHLDFHTVVGGTMWNSAISPADPIFYGWHGFIDKIATTWLTTTRGQQWAAAHPGHRFLQPGMTDMEGWNTTDPN